MSYTVNLAAAVLKATAEGGVRLNKATAEVVVREVVASLKASLKEHGKARVTGLGTFKISSVTPALRPLKVPSGRPKRDKLSPGLAPKS
jgi:nucleoid DNA-binding protein